VKSRIVISFIIRRGRRDGSAMKTPVIRDVHLNGRREKRRLITVTSTTTDQVGTRSDIEGRTKRDSGNIKKKKKKNAHDYCLKKTVTNEEKDVNHPREVKMGSS